MCVALRAFVFSSFLCPGFCVSYNSVVVYARGVRLVALRCCACFFHYVVCGVCVCMACAALRAAGLFCLFLLFMHGACAHSVHCAALRLLRRGVSCVWCVLLVFCFCVLILFCASHCVCAQGVRCSVLRCVDMLHLRMCIVRARGVAFCARLSCFLLCVMCCVYASTSICVVASRCCICYGVQ